MAVSGMSPGNPDPIGTMAQGGQYELRTHPSGTRYTDNPEVMGVLKTAHTGKICRAVTAPVAQKSGNLGLPIIHFHLLIGICDTNMGCEVLVFVVS